MDLSQYRKVETPLKNKCITILLLTFLFIFSSNHTVYLHSEGEPELVSEAAILINAESGQVLYGKDARKKMYPASITKIVTGIIAIEEGDLEDIVSVSKEATKVDGTRVYLLENEEVELRRLVQGLLINSGNDAGFAIAEYISGTEAAFAIKMNKFVKNEVGVKDTNFINPHGLFDENHYTTAYDMAKIAQYAMQNETFREIVGTKEMEWNGKGWQTTLQNHNRMLWDYEGATGIKNGYVSQSGFTLVTSAEREGLELIVVTLHAPSARYSYKDTKKLLDYGFDHFFTKTFTTDRMYTNTIGDHFKLEKETIVTIPKDKKIVEEIQGNSLLIKEEGGTTIFKGKLHNLTDSLEKAETKQVVSEVEMKEQSSHWIWKLIRFFTL
ncbi:D-alanyl-D-alanine carboxypeptidase [bacterium LRH843]|nr:D-alanyl-D-alanine carboxypeptidase [bacterium LRH843]